MQLSEARQTLAEAADDLNASIGSLTQAINLQEQARNLINAAHVSQGEARDRVRAVFRAGIAPDEINEALGMIETTMNAAHDAYGLGDSLTTATSGVRSQCEAAASKLVEVSGN